MSAVTAEPHKEARLRSLRVDRLARPALVLFNPTSGHKLGISVTEGGIETISAALWAAGVPFEAQATQRAGHATELARAAAAEGRELVIAAGGDGTVAEVAQALAGTQTVLGILPLGSIMNTARTLRIPRGLQEAAHTIAAGRTLAMDLGRVGEVYFLEAAGVGLDAGVLAYFRRLDSGQVKLPGALRGVLRFLQGLGTPRLLIFLDGKQLQARAPMVVIANGRYVGAAYALAPDAYIDDGLLDVVVFREVSVPRMLLHLALVSGGRRLPPPPEAEMIRARSVHVTVRRRRPLPVHADGIAIGATPAHFEVVPAALRVIVGERPPDGSCAWRE